MRLALSLFAGAAAVAVATNAGANSPPHRTHEQKVREFRRRVEGRANACRDLVRESSVFGSVEVRFTTEKRFKVRATKSLGPHVAACVTRAVREMIADEDEFPIDYRGDLDKIARGNRIDLWFGTPTANLPEPTRLLPAWRAARAGNPRALRDLLPADVAITTDGCLVPDGGAIRQGVELWLEKWTKPIFYKWDWLFRPYSRPRFVDQVWFVAYGGDGGNYCLLPLDDARERELTARLNESGACWQGTVRDSLLSPRIAFPSDRAYQSVSIARDRACAVEAGGSLLCCGSPKPQPPPAGVFKSVSVARLHACAIRADDTIACWSESEAPALPPFQGRYSEVVVGEVTACARLLDGHFDCRGKLADVWRDDVRQVSMDFTGHCLVRRGGVLECAGSRELPPPPKNVIAVDTNYTTCVLVAGGEVLCPQSGHDGPWGLVSRERFKDIAVTSGGGCGRRPDDTVGCWGRVTGPKGRFKLLEAGETQMCGIRDDGRIVCWGNPEGGYFWSDPSP